MHRTEQIALLISILILASCQSTKKQAPENAALYLEQGQEISMKSFMALSGEVKAQMKSGGVPAALEYCNVHALPLTDSLSKAQGVSIKRTSLKLRNPENAPTEDELEVLKNYEKKLLAQEPVEPIVLTDSDNNAHYYSPIFLNQLCLNCHGTPGKEIETSNYVMVKSLYPEDEAIGYSTGDWRGMWSITFKQ